ncbi:MAG: helix-turn-helix domain-containing protein [Rhodospirillales bacterium]|nr:helix-turn-helix domain-containing protein [Alphaproteobacteria bacterium]MCB9987343.1 helix-turn-helix domain-containing protein [Rhodospirillales bacterium]USO08537.1 MAG: helix-turn-helix domain-containing protein [Rhodospirillales bacterium]
MLSIRQIRAARALLGWSQRDLARTCALSVTAMNNIDRGLVTPRAGTLKKIAAVLEGEGVEFTEGEGVRMAGEVLRTEVFEGRDAFERYCRRLVDTMRREGVGSINILADEGVLIDSARRLHYWLYATTRKYGLFEKIMVPEGTKDHYGPPECSEYRAIPKALTSGVPISVFGDNVAFVLLKKVILVESPTLAEAYRNQLAQFWAMGKAIKGGKCLFYEDEKRFGALKS